MTNIEVGQKVLAKFSVLQEDGTRKQYSLPGRVKTIKNDLCFVRLDDPIDPGTSFTIYEVYAQKENCEPLGAYMSDEITKRLCLVIGECIQYVGSANYEHRERHALNEAMRNIRAARDDKIDEIKFRPEPRE